ncbi:MAG TPA: hypothetical protein VGI87_07265 [Solirubrobacteraceae bacterium]|jgi:hypothetical protein
MGYKVLGFAVWQGGKWYLRRRMSGFALKAAVGGLAVAVVAGVIVAGKQQQSSS